MKKTLLSGLLLGLLLASWMYVIGFTGWYKHPTLQALFWVVVLIQVVVLAWVVRGAAADGAGFGARFGRGAGTSLVASPIVFLNSLLLTQVVFPHYFEELRAVNVATLRARGLSEAQIAEALHAVAAMENPYLQALFGVIGTVVTGVVVSLIAAAIVRKRPS